MDDYPAWDSIPERWTLQRVRIPRFPSGGTLPHVKFSILERWTTPRVKFAIPERWTTPAWDFSIPSDGTPRVGLIPGRGTFTARVFAIRAVDDYCAWDFDSWAVDPSSAWSLILSGGTLPRVRFQFPGVERCRKLRFRAMDPCVGFTISGLDPSCVEFAIPGRWNVTARRKRLFWAVDCSVTDVYFWAIGHFNL